MIKTCQSYKTTQFSMVWITHNYPSSVEQSGHESLSNQQCDILPIKLVYFPWTGN